MGSNLYERSLYLNPAIDYLFGRTIIEFDMKSAGLNLIKYYELLPDDTIMELERMEKSARNKKIGIIQRDDSVFKERLSKAFIDMRRIFFEYLMLEDDDILSIKKDAIFLIDPTIKDTIRFGNIAFVAKNQYTSYLYINRKEFYIDTINKRVDLKGISDVSLHDEYLLSFFVKFASMNENSNRRDMIARYLVDFIRRYRAKELPIGYYRRLSQDNNYVVYQDSIGDYIEIDETTDIDNIDISYNYINYLVPLVSIYL